jgi:hypothetical protein
MLGTNSDIAKEGTQQLSMIKKVEMVSKGLKFLTSMAFLGPNDMVVLEKNIGTEVTINYHLQFLLDYPKNKKVRKLKHYK